MVITFNKDERETFNLSDADFNELCHKVGEFLRDRIKVRWSKFTTKEIENDGLEITVE